MELVVLGLIACLAFTQGSPLKPYVEGGHAVDIELVPHQVAIISTSTNKLKCGGSIISASHILTAAHCVTGNADSVVIRSGSAFWEKNGTLSHVKKIELHPYFNSITHEDDLAVVELKTPLELSDTQQIVVLGSTVDISKNAHASGWASLLDPKPHLHRMETELHENSLCNYYYQDQGLFVSSSMICGGGGETDILDHPPAVCEEDQGGALMQGGKQVGVASWGYGCYLPGYSLYDIYAKLDMGFISSATEGQAKWV